MMRRTDVSASPSSIMFSMLATVPPLKAPLKPATPHFTWGLGAP
jgi:hypothetical protein